MRQALNWAYLAGLIDGEGSLGIYISRSPSRKNAAVIARLKIGMCEEDLIRWLHKVTGNGTVTTWTVKKGTSRPVWVISWNGYSAESVLRQCGPYLRLKRKQAALVLQWIRISKSWHRKLGGRGHRERAYPDHVWRKAEELRVAIQRLNKREPPPQEI